MATNLALDDNLIEAARRVGKHKTKREAVTAALEEYIKHRKRLAVIALAGQVDIDRRYDHKAERRRR